MTERKTKVYIVDDEPLLVQMLSDYLEDRDDTLHMESFPTGEACLEALDDGPDVIILDYYLNSREKDAADGFDILKEIKKKDKSLPVIMLSSQKSYTKAAQTIGFGAIHYVIKGQKAFDEILKLIRANT